MASKVTLNRYRLYKKQIKQESIYDNRYESILLFKARTKTLNLNIEKRHNGESTMCDLCKSEVETDIHFLLECKELEEKRDRKLLQKYIFRDKERIMGELLFRERDIESVKKMLITLWRRRETLRKRLLKEDENRRGNGQT